MENLTVDSVYGAGLYEAARDLGEIDEFLISFKQMRELFVENPDLLVFLQTPTIEAGERKKMVSNIFSGHVSEHVINFISVLIDKRRIGQFVGITKTFEKICDEKNGVTKGEILSAIALDEAQLRDFEEATSKLLQKSVVLENRIDKSILGGVMIYLDGKLIDASVRGRLDELREKIQ